MTEQQQIRVQALSFAMTFASYGLAPNEILVFADRITSFIYDGTVYAPIPAFETSDGLGRSQ